MNSDGDVVLLVALMAAVSESILTEQELSLFFLVF